MASRWIRELPCTVGGPQSGMQHVINSLAWGFDYGLNWSLSGSIGPAMVPTPPLFYGSGVQGEFNLTGTDTNFRDLTINPLVFTMPAAVGAFLVFKTSDNRSWGIYKITAAPDNFTATLAYAGPNEYPVQEINLQWAVFAEQTLFATGGANIPGGGSTVKGVTFDLQDGQNVNSRMLVIMDNDINPPVTVPNSRNKAVIPFGRFNPNNTLIGKVLNWTRNGNPFSVTFTGTVNPLGIADVINQLVAGGLPAYRSDGDGWSRADGRFISYCWPETDYVFAYNLVVTGSTAWDDLGLTGGSVFNNGILNWLVSPRFLSGTLPLPIPFPEDSGVFIAQWLSGAATFGWLLGLGGVPDPFHPPGKNYPTDPGGGIANFRNTVNGTHGNVFPCGAGYGNTVRGAYFVATSPDGWGVEVAMGKSPFADVYLEMRASPNNVWDGPNAKVLGPVYLGSAQNASNYLYMEADVTNSKWVNILTHQSTANVYNGLIVSRLSTFETLGAGEDFCIMGASGSSAYGATGAFKRTFSDTNKDSIGHGFHWSEQVKQPLDIWMVEPSYASGLYGLSKWTSRERNSRVSGSTVVGGTTGDSLAVVGSTVTLTKAGVPFTASDVGKYILIYGCTNPENNGAFLVTAYVGPTQIQFTNAIAIAEVSAFVWTMDVEDMVDGTLVVADYNNIQGSYVLAGRILGHYSCRSGVVSGWANRKVFYTTGNRFHIADGIAIAWPDRITPQH